jgi:protein required for attachment to host cells
MRWIIVADESTAEFYEQDKKYSAVRKSFEMHNDSARKKVDDIITDHGGRSYDSFGMGRHTMAKEKQGPKMQGAVVFAKSIAGKITAALNRGDITDFGLIAAPKFLGILRKSLAGAHGSEPCLTISKEVVGQGTAVVDRLLGEL